MRNFAPSVKYLLETNILHKLNRTNRAMDVPYRSAINDPHQCRLCLRVCDDTFLESIFSGQEYSIAHQIFECTSIRVTQQDNLTKICRNCATLLFITTEFRNACFKTNRLLMEDFVILEVGEWVDETNRTALRSCSELIVKHKQQVDYLYDSIVPDSESYLAGSLDIERELFNAGESKELKDKESGVDLREVEPEEPDPEIIQEITKFLEGQQMTTERGRCQVCSLDVGRKVPDDLLFTVAKYFKSIDVQSLWICDVCRQCLEIVSLWHESFRNTKDKAIEKAANKLRNIAETQRHLLKQFGELEAQLNTDTEKPQRTKHPDDESKKRRKVKCSLCDKQFDSWKMKAHMNEHENKKPYRCDRPACSSAFSGVDLLNRHKKLWHSDYFYKSCSQCGKKCKTQGIYKTHISYHEEPKLPCEVCGKLMRNKRSMWKHMKSHQMPEDREHVCDICNKRFAMAYTLRVHRRIHTNEKPFSCDHCGKQFQYNCLLKNHVERYHS
ncbi:GDNF-inducible zinc finger protein 1-like [Armigeres subalbatus]|uniref:GDNF-inducible zinc finger protein 1-like n=1 Tax=Armigeres subalbatus TaxID=124917 RepID=UPI002ED54DBB